MLIHPRYRAIYEFITKKTFNFCLLNKANTVEYIIF